MVSQAADTFFEIAGANGSRVRILVLAREGLDFLACRVRIDAAGFAADYTISLDGPALHRFHEELSTAYANISGRASLRIIEDTLRLDVEMTPIGGAIVCGRARRYAPEVELTFAFHSDQTYLAVSCEQLADILSLV